MPATTQFLVAHISDLHFSSGGFSAGKHTHSIARLLDLGRVLKEYTLDRLIVSGDLTAVVKVGFCDALERPGHGSVRGPWKKRGIEKPDEGVSAARSMERSEERAKRSVQVGPKRAPADGGLPDPTNPHQ
jgi:hypothetical protein